MRVLLVVVAAESSQQHSRGQSCATAGSRAFGTRSITTTMAIETHSAILRNRRECQCVGESALARYARGASRYAVAFLSAESLTVSLSTFGSETVDVGLPDPASTSEHSALLAETGVKTLQSRLRQRQFERCGIRWSRQSRRLQRKVHYFQCSGNLMATRAPYLYPQKSWTYP